MRAAADSPRRHRLTVDDYYRMAEVGILAPDARTELIDGEIIDMVAPGSPHASTVNRLTEALVRRREDYCRAHHPRPADTLLVVEIADSSLRYDRETKTPLYASHGIPELWLVDLHNRRFFRHRLPEQGVYSLVDEPDLGSALDVSALPVVTVDLQSLLG